MDMTEARSEASVVLAHVIRQALQKKAHVCEERRTGARDRTVGQFGLTVDRTCI